MLTERRQWPRLLVALTLCGLLSTGAAAALEPTIFADISGAVLFGVLVVLAMVAPTALHYWNPSRRGRRFGQGALAVVLSAVLPWLFIELGHIFFPTQIVLAHGLDSLAGAAFMPSMLGTWLAFSVGEL